jgi:hypothetical protein
LFRNYVMATGGKKVICSRKDICRNRESFRIHTSGCTLYVPNLPF